MIHALYLLLYVAMLVTVSCTGKGSLPFGEDGGRDHVSQASDSLYTEERAMEICD